MKWTHLCYLLVTFKQNFVYLLDWNREHELLLHGPNGYHEIRFSIIKTFVTYENFGVRLYNGNPQGRTFKCSYSVFWSHLTNNESNWNKIKLKMKNLKDN